MAILVAALVFCATGVTSAAETVKKGAFYEVRVDTTRSANGSMTATITTVGKSGYHCNMLYPWKLVVDQSEGLSVAKPVQKKEDAVQFTEKAVVFRFLFTASAAVKTLSASLKLSLCDDKQCQMETVILTSPAQ